RHLEGWLVPGPNDVQQIEGDVSHVANVELRSTPYSDGHVAEVQNRLVQQRGGFDISDLVRRMASAKAAQQCADGAKCYLPVPHPSTPPLAHMPCGKRVSIKLRTGSTPAVVSCKSPWLPGIGASLRGRLDRAIRRRAENSSKWGKIFPTFL